MVQSGKKHADLEEIIGTKLGLTSAADICGALCHFVLCNAWRVLCEELPRSCPAISFAFGAGSVEAEAARCRFRDK